MLSGGRDTEPEQAHLATERLQIKACPVCRGTSFAPRFAAKDSPIMACATCGLVLQNPQPSDRELADIYGPDYFIGSADSGVLASQFELVKRGTARLQLDEIAAYLGARGRSPKGLRLIEIGCGHGNMLSEAQNRGYDVHGLEISSDAAAVANRKLGRDVVRVGTTANVNLPQGFYDVCVLADVIEHVRDPRAFMTYVHNILADKGVVFIATPSLDSWSAKLLGRYWMEYKPEHLFYFAPATISKLLTDVGFGHIEITSGRKILTPEYVIGHFDKFPVPLITGALRLLRSLIPSALLRREMKVTASGINVFAANI